jgi:argininosuccinate lyase
LPFRVAHAICSHLVTARGREPDRSLASLVSEISQDLCGRPLTYTEEALETILSPRHFVMVRRTLGGPAPEVTAQASQVARALLDDDRAWASTATASLRSAERRLEERSAAL